MNVIPACERRRMEAIDAKRYYAEWVRSLSEPSYAVSWDAQMPDEKRAWEAVAALANQDKTGDAKYAAIWIVWADRGDYSDRTEYAVCWFATKAEAEARAEALQAKSDRWRERMSREGGAYGETWDRARKDIGDACWCPGDATEYRALELPHGSVP